MSDQFFKVLRRALKKDTSKCKHGTIKQVYEKHGEYLDKRMRKFVELNILSRGALRKEYLALKEAEGSLKIWMERLHTNRCLSCKCTLVGKITTLSTKTYCSPKCSNSSPIKQETTRINTRKKYGVDSWTQLDSVKKKVVASNLKNWGVRCSLQSEQTNARRKEINQERYGVDHHFQAPKVQAQIKKTSQRKYGVDNPMQNKEVKARQEQSLEESYGVSNPMQSRRIQRRAERTNQERYGVKYAPQSEQARAKTKATNLERYGVEHVLQNPEILAKQMKSAYGLKRLRFRGKTFTGLQGYEPQAIKWMVKNNIVGVDAIHECKDTFDYEWGGARRKYLPDLKVILNGKVTYVEVKSTYTFRYEKDRLIAKFYSVWNSGYNMVLLVIKEDGSLKQQVGDFKKKPKSVSAVSRKRRVL